MKIYIIYSSVTGNTKKLALGIKEVFPQHTLFAPVQQAPPPDAADLLILGFWVRRGAPDDLMARYMTLIGNKQVAFFGTLGAYPYSTHAMTVCQSTRNLLASNTILGSFLCQGKVHDSIIHSMHHNKAHRKTHPMTPERIARHTEAAKHPNEGDIKDAQYYFRGVLDYASQHTTLFCG